MSAFSCSICADRVFSSRNKLFAHVREAHVGSEVTNSSADLNRFADLENAFISDSLITADEDEDYKVVVKPQTLMTIRTHSRDAGKALTDLDDLLIPGAITYRRAVPCHRLDRSTGGLVICSKSKKSETSIKMMFRMKRVRKRYRALVPGRLEPTQGLINAPIGGKKSITKYSVVSYTQSLRYGWISTVDLWPVTGRRHQLRRHLQSVGHPILGDKRYSPAHLWPERIGGQELMFLWALEVHFPHPSSAEAEGIEAAGRASVKADAEARALSQAQCIEGSEQGETTTASPQEGVVHNGGDDASEEGNESDADADERTVGIQSASEEGINDLDTTDWVHVCIDEPAYYELFRRCHQDEWEKNQQQQQPQPQSSSTEEVNKQLD
jgi:23S rRNA-/tRNA-specific pseudouridylate synthase